MLNPADMPFSKIRRASGLVFLSGELPIGEAGALPNGITAQTALTLKRMKATLAADGLALADLVQVIVYLRCGEDFAEFNAEYGRHFSALHPTRTTVVAAPVLPGALVEIAGVACVSASAR